MESPHSVRVTRDLDGVSGTVLYEAIGPDGEPVPGPRAVVMARMHGNEPLGDPVLARVAEVVARRLVRGSVLAVRANQAAADADVRHTADGSDLNRFFDPLTLRRLEALDPATASYEEKRAKELVPLLLSADAVLDLHSTSRPAAPFLVVRDDQAHVRLALGLGVKNLVTGVHENGVLSGGMAVNIGLQPGENGGRIGILFEAGQHTDPENGERAWEVCERFLAGLGVWAQVHLPSKVQAEVYEVTERFVQAAAGTEQYRFVGYDGGEAGGGRRGLPPRRLHSFEELQADEVVLRRGAEVVRAQTPFTMLMPAPTTPPGTDLYYVTQPRHGGLTLGGVRTDHEARSEAVAIERMLDLVADDEFERGTTWVAFDSRRLFDLCAVVVGHQLRLDEGHPHRRVVVVGRGDAGGDESERRAGQRYRQAMRTAVVSGLPIERVQLLRGAPLAWLDALTSHGMLELTERRRQRYGPGTGVRMRLSLRQPHTASLLVAGDLDLAIRTGDTRLVRVALLIEAATVEPDGGTAKVRVVRAGLLSTRPEVMTAAASLLHALRDEHRYLVRHGALRAEPVVHELLDEDDAIEAVPDPEKIEALRAALYRAQLRMWCDHLRIDLTEPVRLPTEAHVGRWLARTMAGTGILDADGLRALAVRRDGSGWLADPEAVERMYERVHSEAADAAPVLLFGPAAPPSPPQPLFAGDVTADDLERWVGWRRFVRGVQSVPDTRGKDLDLAFSGADIRDVLVRWFDGARRFAATKPGEVMVVVAGDGLNPTRDRIDQAFELYRAHRAVVLDPHLRYLRIQHAQGTHLSWMKDLVDALHRRPPGGQSVGLQFEVEHGATANVILVLERDRRLAASTHPWTLDGWDILNCAVVLSDLESSGTEDYKVGLFTERVAGRPDRVNHELLHFGRAHCEGLLVQAGTRVQTERGPLATDVVEHALVHQIARWIERVRVWRTTSSTAPRDVSARGKWVARRLGLADARLARALAREMDRDTPPREAAERLWRSVHPWPGPAWNERADALQRPPLADAPVPHPLGGAGTA